jgi:hypothetical protein
MATYRVSRLTVAFDGTRGRLRSLRLRPGGYALPVHEPESYLNPDERPLGYQVALTSGTIRHRFGTLAERELFAIETTWSDGTRELTRTFRTLSQSLAQRVEVLDFHFRLTGARGPWAIPLLRFANYVWQEHLEVGFQVQTIRYRLHARVETEGEVSWALERVTDSDEAWLKMRGEGDCRFLISLATISSEKGAHDPSVHLVPAPPDEFTYLLTALAPPVRPVPLSREPRGNPVVQCPPMFYMTSESALEALHPKGGLLKRLWRLITRAGGSPVALPPRNYPLGSLVRMSDIVIYHWREGMPDLLAGLIDYVRGLGENQLASLQRIVVVSESAEGAAYFDGLKKAVGEIRLARVEPSNPEECHLELRLVGDDISRLPAAVEALDEELNELRWEPPFATRAAFRSAMPVTPLPPVSIPTGGDPAASGPLLAAARTRGGPVVLGEPTAADGTWPLALQRGSLALVSSEVAQYLLADLATHAAMLEGGQGQAYEAAWLEQLGKLRKGETRAERLIFVSVSGEADATDRMKLLPAVLYSGEVAAPVLPFRAGIKQQRRLLALFDDYADAGHEACLSAARRDGSSPGRGFYEKLEKKRRAFQEEFSRVLPAEYMSLLRLVRPKEVVNFSALPFEWLEVDGVGLGYFSKVATVRSKRLATDAGYCADLAAEYNGLIAHDLRVSRDDFRVLIVAPEYREEDQSEVNAFISKSVQNLERRLKREQDKGREIQYTVVRDVTAARLTTLLEHDWALVVYVGHSGSGVLSLPDGNDLSPADLPERAFLDTTVLLMGCDTQGAANLAGSVAGQFLSLGARGVFSTFFPIALGPLADNMFFNLLVYMIGLNYRYGDVLALTRISMLWEHLFLFYAQEAGMPVRPNVYFLSKADGDYEQYMDGWDKFYVEALKDYGQVFEQYAGRGPSSPSEHSDALGRRAQLAGLALSFTGNLRARLFDF